MMLIRQAQGQGWRVERRKNNHLKWVSPTGESVFSASTPSDHRAMKNMVQYLCKYGFIKSKEKS